MVPCHCIIAHPEKAKFLVIKHANGWSPPQLQVPGDGNLMYKPAVVNQGMMQKYGLRTTVLRTILSARNYHCVELEMHASSPRELQAVWMDRENYKQFSRQDSQGFDPFEVWLQERESGKVPEQRSPWEREGWYREAEQWVTDKLVSLGIQASGSIQQFKAGWPVSCLLRVSTVQGQIFFKAAYPKPPGEAAITAYMASQWPDLVAEPLAVDAKRNWLLMRDYAVRKENRVPQARYPEFARALGNLQCEAMERVEELNEAGCPQLGAEFLADGGGRAAELNDLVKPLLTSGKDALSEQEMEALASAMEELRRQAHVLSQPGLPDSLVHLDYRPDNWFVEGDKCRVMDWADVAISHPFMALCQTLDFFETHGTGEPGSEQAEPVNAEQVNAMVAAYLSAFAEHGSEESLSATLETCRRVYPLLRLYTIAQEFQYLEAQGPHHLAMRNLLKQHARSMIAGG